MLCAHFRSKVGCARGPGRPLVPWAAVPGKQLLCRQGLRQAALWCAQHPCPCVRAALGQR